jgi:hypothetical protein
MGSPESPTSGVIAVIGRPEILRDEESCFWAVD